MPEISVIIPSYNHAAFVAEAVESVLRQSISNLELIVVDDGSTDNSLEVISSFSDPLLRVIHQSNQGAHAAINRGLKEATGKYLSVLNSDDVYHPKRLEKTVAVLRADPKVGLVGSYIEIIDNRGKVLGVKHGYKDCPPWPLESPERSFRAGTDLRAALLTENYWSTTTNFVFTRELYHQVGEFRPLRYTHDWDYALRAAKIVAPVLLPEPLMRYRIHEANTIRENQAAMIFEICWCLAVHLPQHIADTEFFNRVPNEDRIDQLLHSIYTFGMERIMSVMLLQRLHVNLELALKLLNPEDPARAKFLDFIICQLAPESQSERHSLKDIGSYDLKASLRKILTRSKPPP